MIEEEELAYISCYQGKVIKLEQSSLKKVAHMCAGRGEAVKQVRGGFGAK